MRTIKTTLITKTCYMLSPKTIHYFINAKKLEPFFIGRGDIQMYMYKIPVR